MTTTRPHRAQLTKALGTLRTTAEAPAPRKMGRPKTGKKSNPEYGAFTLYLRRDTQAAARRLVFPGEISGLVQQLLDEWLARQAKPRR